jgi:putative copper export protein
MRRIVDRLRRRLAHSLALATVLGALLVAAQQGAFTHELGHIAEDLASSSGLDKHSGPAKVCDQCIAFAPLAGAVAAPQAVVLAIPVVTTVAVRTAAAFLVVAALPPRSRGPPPLL